MIESCSLFYEIVCKYEHDLHANRIYKHSNHSISKWGYGGVSC